MAQTPQPGHPSVLTLTRTVDEHTVPRPTDGRHDQRSQLTQLIEQARSLVATLTEQAEADQRAFEEGYRLGFGAGVDVGQERERAAEERRAAAQAEAINRFSRTRTVAEWNAIGQPASGGRYPHYTPEQIELIRAQATEADRQRLIALGRHRYPLPDRICFRCDGRGIIPGGIA